MIAEKDYDLFMMFCILSTLQPYETVVKCIQGLKAELYTTRGDLTNINSDRIGQILKQNGCRFWKTKLKYFLEFGQNDIDLKTATRQEIVDSVKGVGMKLASMFLRDTRGSDYAVMDVHTIRWLKEQLEQRGIDFPTKYEEQEKHMLQIAKEKGKSIRDLDYEIWDGNRIGNRVVVSV